MAPDAAKLSLQIYPAEVLRRKAQNISAVTDEVRAVVRRMEEVMREQDGIGLAAPQIGVSWRLFIADVPPAEGRAVDGNTPSATPGLQVYINPVLKNPLGPIEPYEEGCLSLPDIRGEVLRPAQITIEALDLEGRSFTQTAQGLLARCWQHEVDHLDGVLIIDKMTQISRLQNRAAVRDLERSARPR